MSERERWIVYPLLFLALGAALRDKVLNVARSQEVVCEGLAVFKDGDHRQPIALLNSERLLRQPGRDFLRVDALSATRIETDYIVYRGQPLAEVMNQMPGLWRADLVQILQGMLRAGAAAPPAAEGQPAPPRRLAPSPRVQEPPESQASPAIP